MLQNEEFLQDFIDEAKAHIETLERVLVNILIYLI